MIILGICYINRKLANTMNNHSEKLKNWILREDTDNGIRFFALYINSFPPSPQFLKEFLPLFVFIFYVDICYRFLPHFWSKYIETASLVVPNHSIQVLSTIIITKQIMNPFLWCYIILVILKIFFHRLIQISFDNMDIIFPFFIFSNY
jgi:hypothetical protein